MKFSDGFWLNQRGFDVNYAVSVYEITTTANSITVFATSSAIYNRAMTLGGVTFEITYTSTAPDVIKVSIVHHKGTLKNAPKYELNEDLGYTPEITTGDDFAEMVSGNTKVRIKKGYDWDVEFSYKGKRLTGGAWRATSYIEENQFRADNRVNSMRDDNFWGYPADENHKIGRASCRERV